MRAPSSKFPQDSGNFYAGVGRRGASGFYFRRVDRIISKDFVFGAPLNDKYLIAVEIFRGGNIPACRERENY